MSCLKISNIQTSGWEAAVRGMRFPMNSEDKSDSDFSNPTKPALGKKDLKLMKKLTKAGSDHSKFLRMIHVQIEVTAPIYWWKQADQYKVATTTNSTSTMHKIMERPFHFSDFAFDKITYYGYPFFMNLFHHLNNLRNWYIDYDDLVAENWEMQIGDDPREKYLFQGIYPSKKTIWNELIQLLPSSYMQKRAWDFSYQTLISIIKARRNHKLEEWHDFCNIMLKECPYLEELIEE